MVRISTVAFATLLTAGMVGGFLGCDIDGSKDENTPANETPTQTPGTPAESSSSTSSSSSGGASSGGFVWKPISEGDGNLVILLPPNLTGNVAGVVVFHEGSGQTVTGRYTGVHNGGREHFRFLQPGAAYGEGLTVTAQLKSGGTKSWSVPSGARRVG
jgi:hypothetical protein